ncbi:MAG: S8 family serine peptidase [Actinomycetales bacterium]|uniref:S8 family serine peptidase n=1 Tax=Candidatus Phosphoribacter hodrii TaxID=2953743 RepID=A0A9D7XTN2_9MICO|nr:S8 family serine peptidase [Candidatus Phosphoribacter hodrii]
MPTGRSSGRAEKDFNGNTTTHTRHGSHVAGIIAGKPVAGADAMGIAPRPTSTPTACSALRRWRRLEHPRGDGPALKDGANVVNMSLGANLNNPHSPLSAAADNLTLAGVTTVLAAGNDGQNGAFSLGSPAASALSITVGANDTPVTVPTLKAAVGPARADLRLLAQPRRRAHPARRDHQRHHRRRPRPQRRLQRQGRRARSCSCAAATARSRTRSPGQDQGAKAVLLANNIAEEGFIPYYLGEGLNSCRRSPDDGRRTALTDQSRVAGATR